MPPGRLLGMRAEQFPIEAARGVEPFLIARGVEGKTRRRISGLRAGVQVFEPHAHLMCAWRRTLGREAMLAAAIWLLRDDLGMPNASLTPRLHATTIGMVGDTGLEPVTSAV